ncbi:unnamed protein product [Polarella glacialis]|uniref:Glycosyl transferase family 1 domain-containing protein n=1 Tax=Polarella glacialis TaxID=89957 RepID=A0A813GNA2_POLGL|nr:unnamed protein product [Polarella glacialis]
MEFRYTARTWPKNSDGRGMRSKSSRQPARRVLSCTCCRPCRNLLSNEKLAREQQQQPNPWNEGNRIAVLPSFRLLSCLLTQDWDIVHLFFPTPLGWPTLALTTLRGIPTYCSHHVDMLVYMWRYSGHIPPLTVLGILMYWLCAMLPATACGDANGAPSASFLRRHLREAGLLRLLQATRPESLMVVPTSVDSSIFRRVGEAEVAQDRASLLQRLGIRSLEMAATPSRVRANGPGASRSEPCLWLSVCRLAPEKDVSDMFEALARADSARPGFHRLVLVGGGPLRESLEQEVRQRELPVSFLGQLENSQLPPIYRACDVFVACSTSETFGITILEALSCGLPVVLPQCEVFQELFLTPDFSKVHAYEKGGTEDLVQAIGRALQQGRRAAPEQDAASSVAGASLPHLGRENRPGQLSEAGYLYHSWREATKAQVRQYRSLSSSRRQRSGALAALGRWLCCR